LIGARNADKSVRRRRILRCRPVATLGHEGVELGFVLGKAQPVEKIAEFALLVLQTLQGFAAIFVKRTISARRPSRPAALRGTAHARADPIHFSLHPLDLVLPAIVSPLVAAVVP